MKPTTKKNAATAAVLSMQTQCACVCYQQFRAFKQLPFLLRFFAANAYVRVCVCVRACIT